MHKRSESRTKKKSWFIAVRGSYLPNGWQGWLTYLPFTAFLLYSLYIGFTATDTYPQAVLFVIPNWIAAAVVMTWLAKRTSK